MNLVVHNLKGGVGKSLTAIHMAAAIAMGKRAVCLLDGDTQGHASQGLGVARRPAFERWLREGIWEPEQARDYLEVLPGARGSRGWFGQVTADTTRQRWATLPPYDYAIVDAPGYDPWQIPWLVPHAALRGAPPHEKRGAVAKDARRSREEGGTSVVLRGRWLV